MKRRGFIFNHGLCVACNACSAACLLEHEWKIKPRTIYNINPSAVFSAPVINLSMACNHCEEPACLSGCPANAFSREMTTGAILLDEDKCLGCKYCTWNCPYDSPKEDAGRNLINKCNLCHGLLTEGGTPACVSACPTGALQYGDIPDKPDNSRYLWLPDKMLDPALELRGNSFPEILSIVPEGIFSSETLPGKYRRNSIAGEWSLVAFSFLSALSVAMIFTRTLSDNMVNKYLILAILILAGLFSFFHLGKKLRAWRSLSNIIKSPLSREIASYIAYLFISAAALLTESGGLYITAAAAGLIFLLLIDSVYTFTDARAKMLFHSGQTLLTGLLVGSFFSGMTASFLFVGSLKLASGICYTITDKNYPGIFGFRFLRLALLLATGVIQFTGISVRDPLITCIFLSGELIDRILFYYDFKPVNIKSTISEYTKSFINEKTGD